jgi:uncharacterized protein YndB with AHSA1/START domain
MSCTDDTPGVEREVELPAPPEAVWESLPALFGAGGELVAEPGGRVRAADPEAERVGVVEDVDAPQRITFWWVPVDGDDAPSFVEIVLEPVELEHAVGTMLHVRESRFDAAVVVDGLLRGPLARARS